MQVLSLLARVSQKDSKLMVACAARHGVQEAGGMNERTKMYSTTNLHKYKHLTFITTFTPLKILVQIILGK